MKKHHYDITIIGAGLIGLCMSSMLSKLNKKILVIDKNSVNSKNYLLNDIRTTAISQGTKRILDNLKIWHKIKEYSQPIKKIDVLESTSNKRIVFDSKDLGEGDLGYIVSNSILKKEFLSKINKSSRIEIMDKTEVNDLKVFDISHDKFPEIHTGDNIITSKILIGADGRYSNSRNLINLPNYKFDYKQNAYVFFITHKKSHSSNAFEVFFPEGPLAILPMLKEKNQNRSSVVWTVDKKLGDLTKLKKNEFKKMFLEKYMNLLGDVTRISDPQKYELNVVNANLTIKNRVVFIGDAAQAIHPIAGQGFNLGVRDCKVLFRNISRSFELGLDPGTILRLESYLKERLSDKYSFMGATHFLNLIFSNNSRSVTKLRKIGLGVVQKSKILKNFFMSRAMGL